MKDLRSASSTYQRPSNAQALAALEAILLPVDADAAKASGWQATHAEGYLPPDGILPRMRLLALGWEKPGDKFRPVEDRAWWSTRYKYPLWPALETLMRVIGLSGGEQEWAWNERLAAGAADEIAHVLATAITYDLPPVMEAPCPKWIIPPDRSRLPIANPACIKKPVSDVVDKLPLPRKSDYSWLVWVIIAMAYMSEES